MIETTPKKAALDGYRPITTAYKPSEQEMLDNVLRDMRGCRHLLVRVSDGLEVWRHEGELKTSED